MEKTVITINMDKTSLREAMTRIIEYITLTPPNPEDFFSKFICNDAFLNIKATQESINGKDTYVATEEMLKKQEETLGKPFIE